ncbi:MAG: hypothetical protein IJH75_06735 [Mogibacterium sp.]|nr:hypothetical protein [Mogibacterium sp.]
MIELLEKDRDRLLTELASAHSAEKAVKVLENELDRLLMRYNEQCGNERERDSAAYMMQAVRFSLPLIDSVGETKVWERGAEKSASGKVSVPAILLLIAGVALCAFGLIPLLLTYANTASGSDQITRIAAVAGGAVALFFAGFLIGKPRSRKSGDRQVEIRVDAGKIYRSLRTALLSVDQNLEEIRAAERWSKREQAGNIDGRPAVTPEIDLFSDLLAASYSQDPEYALEKIDEIKYYLHKQQIEVVDFSEETRKYFDLMPGIQTGTIRPALVADGALLKKGLASTGK